MNRKRGVFLNKGFWNRGKRGQIWVETIVYTLIAFALIGLVLAFVKPKIEELQDKGVIEQSISVLEDIDLIIKTLGGAGNQRVIDLGINKGTLNVDGENDRLFFEIESKYTYSEPKKNVTIGNIIAFTEKRGKINDVTLTRNYGGEYNITYQNMDELRKISKAPTPYTLLIANKGKDPSNKIIINIGVS
jgi:type II secretory pathway pseudopilin PulG